jgi:hypothetical protein
LGFCVLAAENRGGSGVRRPHGAPLLVGVPEKARQQRRRNLVAEVGQQARKPDPADARSQPFLIGRPGVGPLNDRHGAPGLGCLRSPGASQRRGGQRACDEHEYAVDPADDPGRCAERLCGQGGGHGEVTQSDREANCGLLRW